MKIRSMLFAPATHERRTRQLCDFGAHASVIDLEDAVADDAKFGARVQARSAVDSLSKVSDVQRLLVRINPIQGGEGLNDLIGVFGVNLGGVVVPKIDSRDSLFRVCGWLESLEAREKMAPNSLLLVPIIETVLGVRECWQILDGAPDRVKICVFGSGDYASELGCSTSRNAVLEGASAELLTAARAAGIDNVLDGPFLFLDDEDGLREDTVRSRDLGFDGRVVVHPSQVAVANDVYSLGYLGDAQLMERIVFEFEAAEAQGEAAIRVGGVFVDYPIYHRARAALAAAGRPENGAGAGLQR